MHWVPASVPGFAPTEPGIGELLASPDPHPLSRIPYSEWYENSLRFADSPVSQFHREHYRAQPYAAFAADFVAGLDFWDPADWARRFAATGARYVVLVAKHHDGWCLWPTDVPNPHRPDWHSTRDIVGELAVAVRNEGMRFGIYYSGGYDWTFNATPIGSIGSGIAAIPGDDYAVYADRHVRELIDRYRPSVLWNDIAWPAPQKSLESLLVHYFDKVPDGVVNDRWMPTNAAVRLAGNRRLRPLVDAAMRRSARRSGGLVPPTPPFFQHRTPEFTTFDSVQSTPWECVRGMDQGFGYNRISTEADHIGHDELLRSLVDIAAMGGNLLLNVGPRGEDASIPDPQLERLGWMADFAPVTTVALRGTSPWVHQRFTTPESVEVRFAATGERVWAFCWSATSEALPSSITLPMRATPTTASSALDGSPLTFIEVPHGLRVSMPEVAGGESVVAIAVDHVTALAVGEGAHSVEG